MLLKRFTPLASNLQINCHVDQPMQYVINDSNVSWSVFLIGLSKWQISEEAETV
jgi:hypothetical protein